MKTSFYSSSKQLITSTLAACVFLFAQSNAALASGINVRSGASSSATSTTTSFSHALLRNLNLASTAARSVIPLSFLPAAVPVLVNGHYQPIAGGSMVTTAEALAVFQILTTGTQSISIGLHGNAIGGSLELTPQLSNSLVSLIIPHGVSVFDNFAQTSSLNLTRNFVNYGNFYALSTNAATSIANISASNIFNKQGGFLSSVIPSNGISNLSLNLSAIHDIINAGTILSAGSLSATAGGFITNSLPAAVAGLSPVMSAMNNVNLQTNTLVNAGQIASINGNVNLAISGRQLAQTAQNININSAGGQIAALNGAINVGNSSLTSLDSLSMYGGDYLSQALNLNAGSGNLNVLLGNVTGVMNTSSGEAHVSTQANTLTLGTTCIAGDPTYFNFPGSIVISAPIAVKESLTMAAAVTSQAWTRLQLKTFSV